MKKNYLKIPLAIGIAGFLALIGGIAAKTISDQLPLPRSLTAVTGNAETFQIRDRRGVPLRISYEQRWNFYDSIPLHDMPPLLVDAFIVSEDKRFFRHSGVDWLARLHAAWRNLLSLKAVRGASTVTEQVVRMIHPRPRTFWSRWLEGWEAVRLEGGASKAEILEFYLNQVPYASNRRGVYQAAQFYFDRDLDTLSRKEALSLAVLVRAPSRWDLYKNPEAIEPAVARLAKALASRGILPDEEIDGIVEEPLKLANLDKPLWAYHFVNYALKNLSPELRLNRRIYRTTLDGGLQRVIQETLDHHLQTAPSNQARNGAALVADHTTGEILAWAVAGENNPEVPGRFIDAVTARRQPGSALKPFLYALAIESGWTASTLIQDSPLIESVGFGLHSYHNYSRSFYGPVTLREALGNSLNIPALRAVQFVGVERYLEFLRALGFKTLTRHPDHYGDGLALGNGEVTLLELVQGFSVLANKGQFISLTPFQENAARRDAGQILSPETSSLIANILSDAGARRLEFGAGGVLNLPAQTAVKTGTSSDYRDAWALGFNDRYTVGAWMGNLDQTSTKSVTGSTGPALILRSVFAELNRGRETRPLYLSPRLKKRNVCREGKEMDPPEKPCMLYEEWFVEDEGMLFESPEQDAPIRLRQPTNGLRLAMDPRIPDEREAFEFVVEGIGPDDRVEWRLNDSLKWRTDCGRFSWNLKRGEHQLQAAVWRDGRKYRDLKGVTFIVK